VSDKVSHRNLAQQREQNWYISRAYLKLKEANYYRKLGKCAESVNSSFESIEFSVKALCKILDVDYEPQHFVDQCTVAKLAEKIGKTWARKRQRLLGVLPVILSYSDSLREIARYGIEKKDNVGPVSPDQIFQKDYCDKVLKDAQVLRDILSQIELSHRWDPSKPITLGIFNGLSGNQPIEKKCEPCATLKDTQFWKQCLGAMKKGDMAKYDISEILTIEVNEQFAVIVNPFGEAYPESNFRTRDTYEQIKTYIENGGVFANTAGFAFFYSWDTVKGERKAISEERFLFSYAGGDKIRGLQELLGFSGTLLYLDFGGFVTSDDTGHMGPHEVETYQTDDDVKRFGNLGKAKLKEFRALRSEAMKNVECIPVVRARCPTFGEIYPIAAIKFGKGYLLVAGFTMETKAEAEFLAKALDAFCEWMSREHVITVDSHE
jgi:HEPN domain-containing protein